MQRVTKKNFKMRLPMLAAAAATVCLGVPKAHAGFVVEFRTPGNGTSTTITPFLTNQTVPIATGPLAGTTEQVNVYVLEAKNLGTDGSTTFTGYDSVITTPGSGTTGAIYIDTSDDINGDGQPDANVFGSNDNNDATGGPIQPQPTFGTATGTILGIAGAAGTSGNAANTVTGSASYLGVGPYINAAASAPPTSGNTNGQPAVTTSSTTTGNAQGTLIAPFVDPNFLNETVHAIEASAGFGSNPLKATGAPVQFENIVVPVGTTFSTYGFVESENLAQTNFAFGVTATTSSTGPTLSLGAASFTPVGTIAVTGAGSGNYNPKVITISPAVATGSVAVGGFNPSTDAEIFALEILEGSAAPSGADLSAIASQLQTALQTEYPGATVTTTDPTPGQAFKASSFFDIFADIPAPGANGNTNLNFDLSELTGLANPATLAAVGVVPEPTGVGVLALGAIGLMARRRRTAKA